MPYPVESFRNVKIHRTNIKRRITVEGFEDRMRYGDQHIAPPGSVFVVSYSSFVGSVIGKMLL